jgi:hypothetical protein
LSFQILLDIGSWEASCEPRLIADDRVSEISAEELDQWKDESLELAVSAYQLVLEDGSDLSDSSEDGNKPDEEPIMQTLGSKIDFL